MKLGMNQSQVCDILGQPTVVRGSIMNKHNQVVEVWEYDQEFACRTYIGLLFA